MDVHTVTASATIYDRIMRRIQKHLADRVRFPFEIRLGGDRAYRFGKGEPAVEIVAEDMVWDSDEADARFSLVK